MPLDQTSYLHSDECANLIRALKRCHDEHFYKKFIGHCSDVHRDMHNCLKRERHLRREASRAKYALRRSNSLQEA